MNLAWMYEGFFLRDLLGFIVPGAIVLGSVLLGADPELSTSLADGRFVPALALGAPLAYAAGLCLHHASVLIRLLTSDHTKALFLVDADREPAAVPVTGPCSTLATLFQYPSNNAYERTILSYYEQMASRDSVPFLRAQLVRHGVLKQVCGQLGAASLVLFVAAFFWSRSDAMNHPNELLRIAMHRSFKLIRLFGGALLLIAHVRHARFQTLMERAFGERLATDSKAS